VSDRTLLELQAWGARPQMLSNAIRGHMAKLGIISAKSRNGTTELLEIIANQEDNRIPAVNMQLSRQRSERSRNTSMSGTGRVNKADGRMAALSAATARRASIERVITPPD